MPLHPGPSRPFGRSLLGAVARSRDTQACANRALLTATPTPEIA